MENTLSFKDLNNIFQNACFYGDFGKVRSLIEFLENLENKKIRDHNGEYLIFCMKNKNFEIAHYLIDKLVYSLDSKVVIFSHFGSSDSDYDSETIDFILDRFNYFEDIYNHKYFRSKLYMNLSLFSCYQYIILKIKENNFDFYSLLKENIPYKSNYNIQIFQHSYSIFNKKVDYCFNNNLITKKQRNELTINDSNTS